MKVLNNPRILDEIMQKRINLNIAGCCGPLFNVVVVNGPLNCRSVVLIKANAQDLFIRSPFNKEYLFQANTNQIPFYVYFS